MKALVTATVAYVLFFVALFLLLSKVTPQGDYVAGVTTAAVGYVAYLVYALGKLNAVQDVAKILILDIRTAESAINEVRTNLTPKSWLKVRWNDNSWATSKHLLVGALNADEFATLDRFFHLWEGLNRTREEALSFTHQSLIAKSAAATAEILKLNSTDPGYNAAHQKVTQHADNDTWLFQPEQITSRATHFLDTIEMVSGTVAFAKLRRIARMKE